MSARPSSRTSNRRRFLRAFLVVFVVLAAVRVAVPFALERYANGVLDELEGFEGRIADVNVNFWRGEYALSGLVLERTSGQVSEPFLDVPRLELELQWGALLEGALVGEAVVRLPTLHVVVGETEEASQTGGESSSWVAQLEALVPFQLNRFAVRDGELRFRDLTTKPMVDLYMTDFYLEALNISNVRATSSELLPATVELAGRPFGTGEFEGRLRFDPLAEPLRFELDASLRKVQLIDLNDVFQAFGEVDAEDGTLGVFVEFAASGGRLEGYVKTLMEDVALVRFAEIEDPLDALDALWEAMLALAVEIVENQPRNRLATIVPVSGELGESVAADLPDLVIGLLRNAFVVALRPALNESVALGDLRIESKDGDPAEWVRRANLAEADR